MTEIVIIDQDDTLWNFLNAHIASYERMFPYIYGVEGYRFEKDVGIGGTTRLSIRNVLTTRGFDDQDITARLQLAEEFMAGVMRSELQTRNGNPGVFPGAKELLYELIKAGCLPVVGTGTSKVISREILTHTGIDAYFQTGAFGCEANDRAGVFRLALQRAQELNGSGKVYVIDDSIKGIEAARVIGARSIAVRSGRQKDQLPQHNPDAIFESVAEYKRIIDYILSN